LELALRLVILGLRLEACPDQPPDTLRLADAVGLYILINPFGVVGRESGLIPGFAVRLAHTAHINPYPFVSRGGCIMQLGYVR
jgi:hypothetical protein